MPKVVIDEKKCKGCGLCLSVCPVKIILLKKELNSSGYHPACIEEMEKCTVCTSCALICPESAIEIWK